MKKIAVTGSFGLIGSRFITLLKEDFNLLGFNRGNGFDITDIYSISGLINENNPDIIIHFAAKTNVDGCEIDKNGDLDKLAGLGILDNNNKINIREIDSMDWKNKDSAFSVNTAGTKNLADVCLQKNIKLIYVSTDFVFSGNDEYYNEEDVPGPVNWYGQTKYWGEKIVTELLNDYIIVRPSFPYGFKSPAKKDFVWKICELLKSKKEAFLVEDQLITPTFIDDIVLGLGFLINKNTSGLYHLSGSSFTTPFDAGKMIAKEFLINSTSIKGVKCEDFYKGRARRGFKLRMKSGKLEKLGFKTKTFEEGLGLIKQSL